MRRPILNPFGAIAVLAAAHCAAMSQVADVTAGLWAGTPGAPLFGQIADDLRELAGVWVDTAVAKA